VTLSSRLGDYGITGTFFLVAQVIAFVVVDPVGSSHRANAILDFLQQLVSTAPALSTPLASLMVALAIIMVFFVGLVIDLLSFYAPLIEVVAFRKRYEDHRHWLDVLLQRYDVFSKPDVSRLIDEYKPIPEEKFKSLFVIGGYERIFKFLLILALESAEASTAQILRDEMSLWRTSRAVATALVILGVEVLILDFFNFRWIILGSFVICATLAAPLVFLSFRRMCESIFVILYIKEHGNTGNMQTKGQVG
jgi:hypothetical protein